jgi:D-alanine-D-alanine ligase
VTRKIRLGILFGGRSEEHPVSVSSAQSMMEAIDSDRFEVVPIGITRDGKWRLGAEPSLLTDFEVRENTPGTRGVLADISGRSLLAAGPAQSEDGPIDVIFPVLHGPYGEDGTVQGLLDLAGIPYVGSGVLGSAVSMDKSVMKALFEHAGLPVAPYLVFTAREFEQESEQIITRIEHQLGLPVFIKPCRLGSSVGISKAETTDELWSGIRLSLAHDRKVIVEQAVRAREVECGVLGNDSPAVSVFGEITTNHAFYDYEAKYSEGLAELTIPARLTSDQVSTLTDIAKRAFAAVDAEGMARVDFFIEKESGTVVLNEINTIPGFAPTSMFPKLWEASGLKYGDLIARLVDLALERHAQRR